MAFGRDANAGTGLRTRQSGAVERLPFRTGAIKTAAFRATYYDLVLCDPTGGGFTVTLPPAAGHDRASITVKNASASTNTITIAAQAGETIDGAGTASISAAREALMVFASGGNWHAV